MAIRQTQLSHQSHLPHLGEVVFPDDAAGVPVTAAQPARLIRHLRLMARFGLVGGSGVLVNTMVLYILVAGFRWHQLPAAMVATEAAIISNFVLNDRWTFRYASVRDTWHGRLWRYNVVALGGLGISLAALAILTMGLGMQYLLANLVGIAAATVWNYGINLRVTWELAKAPIRGDEGNSPAELIVLEDG